MQKARNYSLLNHILMIWSLEIKELEKLYITFKGQMPDLEKEPGQLFNTGELAVVIVYSGRNFELTVS